MRLETQARQAAGPALRRPAAACGDRARHRGGAAAGADGRAAVQPGCQAAAGDACRDPPHPHHAGLLDDLRDARPGRGAVAGRPHHGDDRWPDPADRHAGGALCATGAAPMSRSSWATAIWCRHRAETAGKQCRRDGERRAHPRHADGDGGRARDGGDPPGRPAADRRRTDRGDRSRSPSTTAATSTPWRAARTARSCISAPIDA